MCAAVLYEYGKQHTGGNKMAKKETLTLRRRGEFVVRTRGDSHCGINEVQRIKYSVDVFCKCKLDERGFLFEQRNVDAFFHTIKSTTKSCEVLSKKCTEKLIRLIVKENPECEIIKISVTLCPEPYFADMTYTREFV